jgi:hypothetical protein
LATTPASDLVDIAGNALADSNTLQIYYDVTDPTVTITTLMTEKGKDNPLPFTIVFSEEVTSNPNPSPNLTPEP